MPEPTYRGADLKPAYQLNWGLTLFWRGDSVPAGKWLQPLIEATETDGVKVLKHRVTTHDNCQFFLSTKPALAPDQIIRSVKGRLQYLIKDVIPKAFQRNYSIRSVGQTRRAIVENYVANQLEHHVMADPVVQAELSNYQKAFSSIDLSEPRFSSHGQYWNNLHLVLVNQQRWNEVRSSKLEATMRMIERSAEKHGHSLSRLAILCDHLHMTLGCGVTESPEAVAVKYLNNLAFVYEMRPVYKFGFYAGTIGEYDWGAVG